MPVADLPQRSKLKSLLSWKRPHSSGESLAVQSSLTTRPNISRPILPNKHHSETAVVRYGPQISRKSPQVPRTRAVLDPPPFAQAASLAAFHAILETPAAYSEKANSPASSTDSTGPSSSHDFEVQIAVQQQHKRSPSCESTCEMRQVAFFLTTDGYILQYGADGGPDRLPEKILELGQHSTAVASGDVPGRQWALQIANSTATRPEPNPLVLRSKWSKLTLRSTTDSRRANVLLLVFSDAEDLCTWLHAVRKEIEGLGGAECRPASSEYDRSWRDDLERTYGGNTRADIDQFPPPPAHPVLPEGRDSLSELIVSNKARPVEKIWSASSANTSTSLDRLRDSLRSSGNVSTAAAESLSGLGISSSPGREHDLRASTPTYDINKALPLRALSRESTLAGSQPLSPPKSIFERRQLSVSSLGNKRTSGGIKRDAAPRMLTTVSASPEIRNESRESMSSAEKSDTQLSPALGDRPATGVTARSSRTTDDGWLSTNRPASGQAQEVNKPKYSLFPLHARQPSKIEAAVLAQQAAQQAARSQTPVKQMSQVVQPVAPEATLHQRSRSKTTVIEYNNETVAHLKSIAIFDIPLRSPAVTDAMIFTNFGAQPTKIATSPTRKTSSLRPPELEYDFLRRPHEDDVTPRPVSRGRQRSPASTARSRTMGTAGPPPTRPLPLIPSTTNQQPSSRRTSANSMGPYTRTRQPSIPKIQMLPSERALPELPKPESNEENYIVTISVQPREHLHRPDSVMQSPERDLKDNRSRFRSKSRTRLKPSKSFSSLAVAYA